MLIVLSVTGLLSLLLAGFAAFRILRLRQHVRLLEQGAVVHRNTTERLESTCLQLSTQLSTLQTRFEAIEESRREQAEWAAKTESLNLNRRGQVLRLHRRGDAPVDIAKALQLGLGEVALIIKVFEMGRPGEDRR